MKIYKRLLRLTGTFYLLTGIWPILHIWSFIEVTGPKNDIWLVKTVGLCITACAIGLLSASFRKFVQPDLILVFLSFASFLTIVDIYYNVTDVIAPIYLADAVVEMLLILTLLWWWKFKKPEFWFQKINKKSFKNF